MELRVRTRGRVDFPAIAPTLLLPSGEVVQAGIAAQSDAETVLRYSVPLPRAPLEVVWALSLPDGSLARWRIALDPPPTREALIWQALVVESITTSRDALGGSVLQLSLRNAGPTPLQLLASDVQLTQGSTRLPLGELAALREPLAAGAERVINLQLPPQPGTAPLVLTLGSTRVQLTLAEPEGAAKGGVPTSTGT
ncbi:MAG: hypothetical protein AB4911_22680 [Oscillochloridaceae bacterium umkhey_bin13]